MACESHKVTNFCQKMPFFRHGLLHKLTKCHFSQNLSARLFFSYLHLFLIIINECFMQKTQGQYFSSLFSSPICNVNQLQSFKANIDCNPIMKKGSPNKNLVYHIKGCEEHSLSSIFLG